MPSFIEASPQSAEGIQASGSEARQANSLDNFELVDQNDDSSPEELIPESSSLLKTSKHEDISEFSSVDDTLSSEELTSKNKWDTFRSDRKYELYVIIDQAKMPVIMYLRCAIASFLLLTTLEYW